MQLTDTQLIVLSAALAREDGTILPLPSTLKGGAVAKVCSALLAKGLAEEVEVPPSEARTAPEKVFRTEDDRSTTLRITALARRALNADLEDEASEPATEVPAEEADSEVLKKKAARRAKPAGNPPQVTAPVERSEVATGTDQNGLEAAKQPRPGTKLDRLIELLRHADGVSIKEASEALEWMQHSVRGAVAGALKKKYGLTVLSAKVEGRGTVYRVAQ